MRQEGWQLIKRPSQSWQCQNPRRPISHYDCLPPVGEDLATVDILSVTLINLPSSLHVYLLLVFIYISSAVFNAFMLSTLRVLTWVGRQHGHALNKWMKQIILCPL